MPPVDDRMATTAPVSAIARFLGRLALALGCLAATAIGAAAATGGQLFSVQLLSHGAETRLTLGIARASPFHASIDAATGRLLIDFPGLMAIPGSAIGRGAGLIRAYRAEPLGGGGVRLAFDLDHAAVIADIRTLPAEAGRPARCLITLKSASVAAMRAASAPAPDSHAAQSHDGPSIATLLSAPLPAAPLAPAENDAAAPRPASLDGASAHRGVILSSRRVIVSDAGHGGIDPGAPSVAGFHEKEVTLATARALGRVLEQTGRYKVVLTRDSDVFLKLQDRVARARAAHGNLFISLHADSVAGAGTRLAQDQTTRGASIYTLSETASDAESERYAQRENRADAIGGVALGDQSDDVAGILVDLTVRETVNEGNRLAEIMADSLRQGGIALLPRAPHRAAGFAVLKAPDIPSVLIEMGYLSDPADSRELADPRHQLQTAKAIAEGVDRYFAWLDSSRS